MSLSRTIKGSHLGGVPEAALGARRSWKRGPGDQVCAAFRAGMQSGARRGGYSSQAPAHTCL